MFYLDIVPLGVRCGYLCHLISLFETPRSCAARLCKSYHKSCECWISGLRTKLQPLVKHEEQNYADRQQHIEPHQHRARTAGLDGALRAQACSVLSAANNEHQPPLPCFRKMYGGGLQQTV